MLIKLPVFGGQHRVKARKYLDQGYPVYLSGKPAGKTEGHAWVIDGYSGDYFHCNLDGMGTVMGIITRMYSILHLLLIKI